MLLLLSRLFYKGNFQNITKTTAIFARRHLEFKMIGKGGKYCSTASRYR